MLKNFWRVVRNQTTVLFVSIEKVDPLVKPTSDSTIRKTSQFQPKNTNRTWDPDISKYTKGLSLLITLLFIIFYFSNVDEMQNVMEMHGAGRPRTRDDFGQGGQDGQDGPENEFCIKMRGLPYSATDHDIIDFFEGESSVMSHNSGFNYRFLFR